MPTPRLVAGGKTMYATHRFTPFQTLFVCLALVFGAANAARADEGKPAIGKAVFLTGQVSIAYADKAERPLLQGEAIGAGSTIRTGADGHVYFRMVDNGFLAVRPNSQLSIETYAWHPDQPEKNAIRLVTEKGTVRSVTGQAGQASKEHFRMNTPIAAIGVRGTDFTVVSSPEVVHVAVQQGAVRVAPFGAGCEAGALGPCHNELARDLSETNKNMALEVHRAQAPALIPADRVQGLRDAGAIQPDAHAAAGKDVLATTDAREKYLDTRAAQVLDSASAAQSPAASAPLPPQAIWWGRWLRFVQPGESGTAVSDLFAVPGRETTVGNAVYAIVRQSQGSLPPSSGVANFQLAGAEAWVRGQGDALSPARVLPNATLSIDFGRSSFATRLDVAESASTYRVAANGKVDNRGFLFDNGQTSTTLRGAVAANGTQAAYTFSQPVDNLRQLIGATFWRQ
jgi:hypothetical protein